ADRDWRTLDQCVARNRQFRADRLDGLSSIVGARLFARFRPRQLPLAAADLGHRHVVYRRQLCDDDTQIARPGHDLYAHAGVLLDRAGVEHADRRSLSGSYRDLRDAAARPVSGDALLYE